MGRDEEFSKAKRVREAQAFASAVASGAAGALPRDRFGVVLRKGLKVLYRPPADLVFEVADVTPVVDPRLATGLVTVVLTCVAPITVPVGRPTINFLAIGEVTSEEEAPDPEGKTEGEGESPAEPSAEAPPSGLVDERGAPLS